MPQSSSRKHRRRHSPDHQGGRRKSGWLGFVFKWLAISGICAGLLVAIGVGYLYYKIAPELPDVEQLREVQLQIPLRIYTADGDLIAEYGEKRREPVQISEVPDSLKNAIIAAEDKRFYDHPGVDYQGLIRAAVSVAKSGGRRSQGGSTITMQVARNFFLTREKTYIRKVREIFLSFKIERLLEKDEILELYVNKIYLGNRSYGFAAASKVYYGKKISDLELVESAMLAGLPKAPSRYNPVVNPERALLRRDYVLGRMHALEMIDTPTYEMAKAQPVTASLHYSRPEAEANYVGEMARARMEQLFGDNWATAGYNVFTTIKSDNQNAANLSLRDALYDYERRHGYTGPVAQLDADVLVNAESLMAALKDLPNPVDTLPAAVLAVENNTATVITEEGIEYNLPFEDVEWARERIEIDKRGDELTDVSEALAVGDVITLQIRPDGSVRFVQLPSVEGAFVSMEPTTGSITSLVGGYDFFRSKFNRVTQARRQPGSTFKPFIYSAALAAGDTAATIYNDAPVVFHDDALEGEWRPQNYSGRFFGPTRLREALVKSRNLVSVRVLREIGIEYAVDYAKRFGFAEDNMPPDLSLALGSAVVTPMELTSAFAIFANGGYRVQPHFIDRVEGPRGEVIYSTPKVVLCDDCDPLGENPLAAEMQAEVDVDNAGASTSATTDTTASGPTEELAEVLIDAVDAPRVIDPRNAYIMNSMMREVVRRGTARRAGEALNRKDLAGKTGTTNNQLDAWFVGHNPTVVAAAWIGSDGLDPLGRREAGGIAALPMWTSYMAATVSGTPVAEYIEPVGIETIRIDRKTGLPGDTENSVLEMFFKENMPEGDKTVTVRSTQSSGNGASKPVVKTRKDRKKEVEQLF